MQPIEHDGKKGMIELYDSKKLEGLMGDKRVKEVRVFRLKRGMILTVYGTRYKVVAARDNGKVTLKPIKGKGHGH